MAMAIGLHDEQVFKRLTVFVCRPHSFFYSLTSHPLTSPSQRAARLSPCLSRCPLFPWADGSAAIGPSLRFLQSLQLLRIYPWTASGGALFVSDNSRIQGKLQDVHCSAE